MKILNQNIKLEATKGSRTIAKADSLFDYIDSNFINYGTNIESEDSNTTEMAVLEQDEDGTFKDIFTSISKNLDSMVMTQSQIIEFCKIHKDLLHQDWYTFFIFKVNNEFFVAYVRVNPAGNLDTYADRFSDDYVWYAEGRYRFVVPQLALSGSEPLNLSNLDSLTLENAIKIVKENGYKIVKDF